MYTQALLSLSTNAQQIKPNQGNASSQPITAVLLNNNSPVFVLVTAGNITDYIAPFSPYVIKYDPPTASPTAITVEAMSATSGTLATTVYQKGDPIPSVSLGTSAPTSVGISGTVDVNIANTPSVTVSSGSITIASGTIDIGPGSTVNVENTQPTALYHQPVSQQTPYSFLVPDSTQHNNIWQGHIGTLWAVNESGASQSSEFYVIEQNSGQFIWATYLAPGQHDNIYIDWISSSGSQIAVRATGLSSGGGRFGFVG